jgi:uncharacterized protein (DUF1697 family)
MRFVAFLRNVNLGQPGSPARPQLEAAFLQAGASAAASVMSNGTLVFTVQGRAQAPGVASRACVILAGVCGLNEPAFLQEFDHLARLVAEDPYAGRRDLADGERFYSLFRPGAEQGHPAPIVSSHGNCTIFRIGSGEAFSVTRVVNGKPGYPTPVLEAALGVPATTRAWMTILRLVNRHA